MQGAWQRGLGWGKNIFKCCVLHHYMMLDSLLNFSKNLYFHFKILKKYRVNVPKNNINNSFERISFLSFCQSFVLSTGDSAINHKIFSIRVLCEFAVCSGNEATQNLTLTLTSLEKTISSLYQISLFKSSLPYCGLLWKAAVWSTRQAYLCDRMRF